MSNPDPKVLRALETKLTNLVRCIIDRAETDASFAAELESILLSDSLKKSLREKKGAGRRERLNPVAFLHEFGREKLEQELAEKPESELRDIVRAEGILRGKELKSLERHALISEIISHADRRLRQGSSFLRND